MSYSPALLRVLSVVLAWWFGACVVSGQTSALTEPDTEAGLREALTRPAFPSVADQQALREQYQPLVLSVEASDSRLYATNDYILGSVLWRWSTKRIALPTPIAQVGGLWLIGSGPEFDDSWLSPNPYGGLAANWAAVRRACGRRICWLSILEVEGGEPVVTLIDAPVQSNTAVPKFMYIVNREATRSGVCSMELVTLLVAALEGRRGTYSLMPSVVARWPFGLTLVGLSRCVTFALTGRCPGPQQGAASSVSDDERCECTPVEPVMAWRRCWDEGLPYTLGGPYSECELIWRDACDESSGSHVGSP
jgi:hypothetical protein